MRHQHHEDQTLKDIEAGRFRDCYLVYNRKSSDDTDNQKNSIKYQRGENVRFALRERLQIAALTVEGFATDGVISERHSGFKEDLELMFGESNFVQYRVERPKFHRLVQLLSRGYFKGVIILCWDRASRNKGDDTILRKLMKAGVDIRFTLARYDNTSAGALHMDIDGMFAEHHSRVTSEKVRITKRALRERGVCTFRAPVGYLNLGNMYEKPIDPERAPIVRKLFEFAAAGDLSLVDLARWATDQGFTMPPMRRRRTGEEILAEEDDDVRLSIQPVARKPTFTTIQKILTNPFYTGRFIGNDGVLVKSISHEPLISEELFNRVQRQLRAKQRNPHYILPKEMPLRRLVACAGCGRKYSPYVKKGIVYYSPRCNGECTNPLKSVNFAFIASKVGTLLEQLSFTEDECAEIDARVTTDIALLETGRLRDMDGNARRKKKVREDLAYLEENRLTLLRTGAYSPESLVETERGLALQLETLKQEEDASDMAIRETVEDAVKLSELLKDVATTYYSANPSEKERIIRIVFSELKLSENTLEYKCRNGMQALEGLFRPSGCPNGWPFELLRHREAIRRSINELTAFVAAAANDNEGQRLKRSAG
jgi:DNA invertase Pin-like site-specific DNA recombinase